MEHSYDLIVIGGGPAGGAVASPCSEAGLSVAMLEKDAFGGVCPLRGCNPKKVLLGPAELRAAVHHLAAHGLEGDVRINWPQLMDFVRSFTRPVPDSAENAYQMKGIETYHGAARFLDAHRVQVGEDVLHGKYIAICSGRVPRPVSFAGVGPLPTSNEFLELEELPRRIACIGGGVVAVELAGLALHAGATVHLLHRSERLLRGFDPDCVTALMDALGQAGMDIHINTSVLSVTPTADGLLVVFDQDGTEQAVMVDALFNFAGREADVAGLDLPAAGLLEETPGAFRAGVPVSPTMQTTQPHLFAVGDCAATPFNLTPSASLEGAVAAAFGFKPALEAPEDWGGAEGLGAIIARQARAVYQAKFDQYGQETMTYLERMILLQVVDSLWKDHLLNMDYLKEGIGLRGYGQKDPLREYQREGYELFMAMVQRVQQETASMLLRLQLRRPDEVEEFAPAEDVPLSYSGGGDGSAPEPAKRKAAKVGRNDPCPCGSGKKYKKCCGAK